MTAIEFLRRYRPNSLVKSSARGEYQLAEHDSFKINGESSVWHWKSRDIGGKSALKYLIYVEGVPFVEAVQLLCEESPMYIPVQHEAVERERPPFKLPRKAPTNDRVTRYLLGRGISLPTIRYCIERKILYESAEYHNCVFLGKDPQGVPKYAALRGIYDYGKPFKREAPGSQKQYGFCIPPMQPGTTVAVFEAAMRQQRNFRKPFIKKSSARSSCTATLTSNLNCRTDKLCKGKAMSNMKIIEIPAYLREGAGRKNTVRKLRVAAYCRVSTEEEEQQGSFEIQKLYYTEKINSTPEWEVAGIYADDGISGVHTKKRDGFNQMIQDCKKHRIDLILTKSISRFARNTLDSIQYVRMLKQMGIAVVFEKENINTATMNSEMILTVLSAFAQAESESISQNVARGKRMGYKHGKFAFPYGRIIGYRKGADGKPEIIPEQAEVIRLIFNSYLQGDSLQSIKAKLETAGALTARGNTEWSAQSIQRILQNEKYCGDVLLQKTFTEDVLTGVHKKNTGQLPQYYIENYHEGIVSKQIFREVQAEIARRNSKSAANQRKRRRGRYNSKYALSERLFCGDCGSPYKRVTWNIHGRKQIVWRCVNRIEYGTKFCSSSPSVPEEELHRAILKAVQDLAANFTDEVAAQINGILHNIQTGESTKPNLQEQLEQTQQEFDRLLEMSLDFDEDTPFLDNRLKKLNNKIKSLKKAIEDSAAQQEKASQPEMLLSAKDLQIQEYDDALTARIIEKITVRSRNEIEIQFTGDYKKSVTLR